MKIPITYPQSRPMIVLLLKNGQLFGPFKSKEDARYWALAQELEAHSTYEVINSVTGQPVIARWST